MRIPHPQLSSATLRAIVEEFVTRDGTDHSSVERRMKDVPWDQLLHGAHFDADAIAASAGVERDALIQSMYRIIETQLTDRQRTALLAELNRPN